MLFGGHHCHHKKLYGNSLTNDELDQLFLNTDTIEFKLDLLSAPHLLDLEHLPDHYPNIKNFCVYHTDEFFLKADFCPDSIIEAHIDAIERAKNKINMIGNISISKKPFGAINYMYMLERLSTLYYSNLFIEELKNYCKTKTSHDTSIWHYIHTLQQWNKNFSGESFLELINEC